MSRECEGPDCQVRLATYDDNGLVIDPARVDLPLFKLTYYDPDEPAYPDSDRTTTGVYKTAAFCSRECMDAFIDANQELVYP